MKNILLILFGIIICINSCRLPEDPYGIDIIQHIGPILTTDECLDLDINDSILVAAVNYDGFIIYNLFDSAGNFNLQQIYHGTNLNSKLPKDRINKVLIIIAIYISIIELDMRS